MWLIAGVLLPATVAAACGQPARDQTTPTTPPATAAGAVADPAGASAVTGAEGVPRLPVAEASGPAGGGSAPLSADEVKLAPALPPAADLDELATAAERVVEVRPVSISIDAIGLDEVAVQAVGVEPSGEMSIPPPREVGWYRYGPEPGGAGSAVLAGHIASGGIDGAFRHLDQLEPGDRMTVALSDGRQLAFVVSQRVQMGKADLPFDQLFARSGPPKLALITCGGEFDYDARSYRDNIVVVAEAATPAP